MQFTRGPHTERHGLVLRRTSFSTCRGTGSIPIGVTPAPKSVSFKFGHQVFKLRHSSGIPWPHEHWQLLRQLGRVVRQDPHIFACLNYLKRQDSPLILLLLAQKFKCDPPSHKRACFCRCRPLIENEIRGLRLPARVSRIVRAGVLRPWWPELIKKHPAPEIVLVEEYGRAADRAVGVWNGRLKVNID